MRAMKRVKHNGGDEMTVFGYPGMKCDNVEKKEIAQFVIMQDIHSPDSLCPVPCSPKTISRAIKDSGGPLHGLQYGNGMCSALMCFTFPHTDLLEVSKNVVQCAKENGEVELPHTKVKLNGWKPKMFTYKKYGMGS